MLFPCRVVPSQTAISKNVITAPQNSSVNQKEMDEAMRKLKEASSLISGTVDSGLCCAVTSQRTVEECVIVCLCLLQRCVGAVARVRARVIDVADLVRVTSALARDVAPSRVAARDLNAARRRGHADDDRARLDAGPDRDREGGRGPDDDAPEAERGE